MQYDDLQPYVVGKRKFKNLISIGWLGDSPYLKGVKSDELIYQMKRLIFSHYELCDYDYFRSVYRAPLYRCPICKKTVTYHYFNITHDAGRSEYNLRDLLSNKIYVFPDLILHYMQEHSYQPPDAFIDSLFAAKFSEPFKADPGSL